MIQIQKNENRGNGERRTRDAERESFGRKGNKTESKK
jgi:hypothetical protein